MPNKPPGRYWVIRHPSSQGAVVAKFDSNTDAKIIPDKIADSSKFVIQKVADGSELVNKPIDHSELSDGEKELLELIYPVSNFL